jgi:hypothetical protein
VRDINECNDYFSMINEELHKNFVEFWTQHQRFTKSCDPDTCSKLFIVDGHQKSNRLICKYENVFDRFMFEMGPAKVKHSGHKSIIHDGKRQ